MKIKERMHEQNTSTKSKSCIFDHRSSEDHVLVSKFYSEHTPLAMPKYKAIFCMVLSPHKQYYFITIYSFLVQYFSPELL